MDGASPEVRSAAGEINRAGIFEMLKLETPNLHEIGLDRVIAYVHTYVTPLFFFLGFLSYSSDIHHIVYVMLTTFQQLVAAARARSRRAPQTWTCHLHRHGWPTR